MNIPLIVFDLLLLPVTLFRILIIYFFGSRYNVTNLNFLDVMMHSDGLYFNQLSDSSISTISDDIRTVILEDSKKDIRSLINDFDKNTDLPLKNKQNENNEDNKNNEEIKTVKYNILPETIPVTNKFDIVDQNKIHSTSNISSVEQSSDDLNVLDDDLTLHSLEDSTIDFNDKSLKSLNNFNSETTENSDSDENDSDETTTSDENSDSENDLIGKLIAKTLNELEHK